MAFFDNSYSSEYAYGTVATEAYDADFGGLDNILAECYEDELSVIKSIHAIDMAEIGARKRGVTESAELAIAMEGAIGDFFSNIKDNLKTLFAKISAWFKSIFEKMFVFSKSNKSFAETYKKQLEEVSSYVKTVKYTGYAWKHSLMADGEMSTMNAVIADIEKYSEGLCSETERRIDAYRSNYDESVEVGKRDIDEATEKTENSVRAAIRKYFNVGDETAGGVRAAVIGYYRNGDSKSEQTYDLSTINKALDVLATIDEKPFKKAHSIVSKNFDKAIKVIDRAEKNAMSLESKPEGEGKYATDRKTLLVDDIRALNKVVTQNKQTALNIVSGEKTVATEYAAEIKSVTIKAIAEGKAKKKEANKKK